MGSIDPLRRSRGHHPAITGLLVFGIVALSACTSIGPQRLERDNTAYNDALGETWKRQMLLNMVKLRYGDAPVFLNVASLINQYSLEGQISVNSPGWDQPNNVGPPIAGAAGRWADRPTITYAPVSGEHFTRSLLTPIQPMSLLSMVQSGWPVEFVFGVAVRSINGIANGTRAHSSSSTITLRPVRTSISRSAARLISAIAPRAAPAPAWSFR